MLFKKTIPVMALSTVAGLVTGEMIFFGYRYRFGPFRSLGENRIRNLPGNRAEYAMDGVLPLPEHPLKGKNVLFLGSSVTYGETSMQDSIPEYFAARFGCTVTKEAVSGTTLVNDRGDSYVSRLKNNVNVQTDYSLIIVQLSTNDASQKKPLGTITEGFEKECFDTHTVTGAMEAILAYCKEIWGCPVMFYTNVRYASAPYEAIVRRVYELKEKWNFEVLNLWSDSRFNDIGTHEKKLYMNDPIHPTKAGYREWLCPELERQLSDRLSNRG